VPSKKKPGYDLLVITGPTASGKTVLAANLASRLGGEVISADSRQVYRGMDIGTGKDLNDFLVEGKQIPYHLINIAESGYKYNVFEFQRDFKSVYEDLLARNTYPVVCGCSGMYIDSIISGYKLYEVPQDDGLRVRLEKKTMKELTEILSTYRKLHNITDIDTKKRVIRAIEIEHHNKVTSGKQTHFPVLKVLATGVMYDRESRRKKITERLMKRLDSGMVDEVKKLLDSGISWQTLIYYGLEYKYITLYLTGKMGYNEMVKDLETAIHQFAKRQMTWFRGMERKGIKIHWLDGELPLEEKIEKVLGLLYN
jgi:tRNA dimethylallyltransferase